MSNVSSMAKSIFSVDFKKGIKLNKLSKKDTKHILGMARALVQMFRDDHVNAVDTNKKIRKGKKEEKKMEVCIPAHETNYLLTQMISRY